MTDTKPVFDAILRNLLRLFGTSYATVQLLRDDMLHMAALDGELGLRNSRPTIRCRSMTAVLTGARFCRSRLFKSRQLLTIPPPHPPLRSLHASSDIIR